MTEAAILRLMLSLLFIIALILAGAWLTRRSGWLRSRKNQAVRLIGTQSLGSRAYVALVEVEDRRLVLGVTAGRISLLQTLSGPDNKHAVHAATELPTPAPAFAASLKQIIALRR